MKKVLLTGAYGFLGSYIRETLSQLYEIKTLGRVDRSDCVCDISASLPEFKERFDIVVHAAGKAHVQESSEEGTKSFFTVNFIGTKNLCKALEKTGVPKAFVYISSVSVYGVGEGMDITEEYPLNGETPYARSKIYAEQFLIDWCILHDVVLSIIRPPLVVGKNAPGNLGAMVRGIQKGFYCRISGIEARKSLVLAEDIARVIPVLWKKGGIYNLCGSYNPTIRELEDAVILHVGRKNIVSLPYWIVKIMAKIGDLFGDKFPINSVKLKRLTMSLTFSNEKARRDLGWEPRDVIKHFEI